MNIAELPFPIDRERVAEFCRARGICRLSLFGSVLRDDFDTQRSDVDVLADFEPGVLQGVGLRYFGYGDELGRIPGWKVDFCSRLNPYIEASGLTGNLPTTASGLALSRDGVRVTTFGPNRDGAGTILRVWEQGGDSGEITVTLPNPVPFTNAQPVNLRGEPAGPPLAVRGGTFSFPLPAYAPASFVLNPELPVATAINHAGEPP